MNRLFELFYRSIKNTFLLACFVFLLCTLKIFAQSGEKLEIETSCALQHKVGTEEFLSCVSVRLTGLENYKAIIASYDEGHKLQKSFSFCERQWGVIWELISECANTQIFSYERIPSIIRIVPENYGEASIVDCESEWRPQYDMIELCVIDEIEYWFSKNSN